MSYVNFIQSSLELFKTSLGESLEGSAEARKHKLQQAIRGLRVISFYFSRKWFFTLSGCAA
jgi:hypothetical protein